MDQARVKDFLLNPESYSFPVSDIQNIETHISNVFLTGDFVFKFKKQVKFPFLDFSTLEKRKHFCEREVKLNKRLSPEIYLGTGFVGEQDGKLFFNSGTPVEYFVKMKQLSQENKMDVLLDNKNVSQENMKELAEKISSFHSAAEAIQTGLYGNPKRVWGDIENLSIIQEVISSDKEMSSAITSILEASKKFIDSNKDLFEERVSSGFVRVCHGDLHAANIFLDDKVNVFDCIEFNEDFMNIDTANDIAFLLMDLEFRGRKDLADCFLEEYVSLSGDKQALSLLSLYKCYRANVRAKVAGLRAMQVEGEEKRKALEECKSYLSLAKSYSKKL